MNLGHPFEALDIVGFSQHDVHPAAVSFPPGFGGIPAVELIGMSDAAVVLPTRLVVPISRCGIAVLPECLNEELPFPVRF